MRTASLAQIGVGLERALQWLHPDAVDRWKMTMRLSHVVETCADPSKRLPRQVSPVRSVMWLDQHDRNW